MGDRPHNLRVRAETQPHRTSNHRTPEASGKILTLRPSLQLPQHHCPSRSRIRRPGILGSIRWLSSPHRSPNIKDGLREELCNIQRERQKEIRGALHRLPRRARLLLRTHLPKNLVHPSSHRRTSPIVRTRAKKNLHIVSKTGLRRLHFIEVGVSPCPVD